jgi:hypothetical protein
MIKSMSGPVSGIFLKLPCRRMNYQRGFNLVQCGQSFLHFTWVV